MIETKSLRLLRCNEEILSAAIEGDLTLENLLNIKTASPWTEFGTGPLQYSLLKLAADIEETGWLTYFPIHKQDLKLVGSCGYKGKPTETGTVEIGYETAPDYRSKGLAAEMAEGLIFNAFADHRVKTINAHTLCEENASTKILTKFGFVKVAEINDPDDGLIWKWELKREIKSI